MAKNDIKIYKIYHTHTNEETGRVVSGDTLVAWYDLPGARALFYRLYTGKQITGAELISTVELTPLFPIGESNG